MKTKTMPKWMEIAESVAESLLCNAKDSIREGSIQATRKEFYTACRYPEFVEDFAKIPERFRDKAEQHIREYVWSYISDGSFECPLTGDMPERK